MHFGTIDASSLEFLKDFSDEELESRFRFRSGGDSKEAEFPDDP